jgi:uncharacterized alkaline shock family protein YloU
MAGKKEEGLSIGGNTTGVAGTLEMSEKVVATIANYVASQVPGLHSIGKSGLNFALDGRTLFATGAAKGVDAEVGQVQAALDLDVVIDYGCNIQEVASDVRTRVAEAVKQMAGREVIEVNINVVGIELPKDAAPTRRVQ